MTLKTTKEQRNEIRASVLRFMGITVDELDALCRDAGRAEELEKEVARLDAGWTEAIEVSNAFYAQTCKLQKEIADLRTEVLYARNALNSALVDDSGALATRITELAQRGSAEIADLHAKLDRFEHIAEHGKSYGDDLDNIERLGELEKEIADLKGWIKHYERGEPESWKSLRQENADLRAKLDTLWGLAERIIADGIYEIQENEGPLIVTPAGYALLEELDSTLFTLKEQEKV